MYTKQTLSVSIYNYFATCNCFACCTVQGIGKDHVKKLNHYNINAFSYPKPFQF